MRRHPDIGQVHVCHLALEPQGTAALPGCLAAHPTGPMVLTVGRMSAAERYKGHDQLIDAWPGVLHRIPGATLMIVGDGDDRQRLQQKSLRAGLASSVTFTGYVDQQTLSALYAQAALFSLPSRGEGFGLVYLEAMSHGLPCIGSIHDAAGEVIEDGKTGRLVSQDDIDGMAMTISDLLSNESDRKRMGAAGRRRLDEQFSFERFSKRMEHLFDSTFTGSSSRT